MSRPRTRRHGSEQFDRLTSNSSSPPSACDVVDRPGTPPSWTLLRRREHYRHDGPWRRPPVRRGSAAVAVRRTRPRMRSSSVERTHRADPAVRRPARASTSRRQRVSTSSVHRAPAWSRGADDDDGDNDPPSTMLDRTHWGPATFAATWLFHPRPVRPRRRRLCWLAVRVHCRACLVTPLAPFYPHSPTEARHQPNTQPTVLRNTRRGRSRVGHSEGRECPMGVNRRSPIERQFYILIKMK